MYPCHRCRRHVMVDSAACPFCAAPQRNGVTPIGGFVGVLLGLALVGCGDDGTAEESGASMSASDPSTGTDPTSGPNTMSTSGPTGTMSSSNEEESAEAADYGTAGPSP